MTLWARLSCLSDRVRSPFSEKVGLILIDDLSEPGLQLDHGSRSWVSLPKRGVSPPKVKFVLGVLRLAALPPLRWYHRDKRAWEGAGPAERAPLLRRGAPSLRLLRSPLCGLPCTAPLQSVSNSDLRPFSPRG